MQPCETSLSVGVNVYSSAWLCALQQARPAYRPLLGVAACGLQQTEKVRHVLRCWNGHYFHSWFGVWRTGRASIILWSSGVVWKAGRKMDGTAQDLRVCTYERKAILSLANHRARFQFGRVGLLISLREFDSPNPGYRVHLRLL